jgi:hypothetical protein
MEKSSITPYWKAPEDVVPTLDSFGKPLPSPPLGYYWIKKEDHSWELARFSEKASTQEHESFDAPVVLEHIIVPGDTLQGLCLRYRVSAVELRRHNNFSGNNISYLKKLRIPIDHSMPVIRQSEDSHEVMIQKFRQITHENVTEAKYYMEESGWDIKRALEAWHSDSTWSGHHVPNRYHADNVIPVDENEGSIPASAVINLKNQAPRSAEVDGQDQQQDSKIQASSSLKLGIFSFSQGKRSAKDSSGAVRPESASLLENDFLKETPPEYPIRQLS